MDEISRLRGIVKRLRGEDGCPWDRAQTHASLKPACIEEAAEVICGINILEETGGASDLCEELGDLLLQVVMHAQIAEEEGLFDLEDVAAAAADKMVRRHPHIFGEKGTEEDTATTAEAVRISWEEIKRAEKKGREEHEAFVAGYLAEAMKEAKSLIEVAEKRKGFRAEA